MTRTLRLATGITMALLAATGPVALTAAPAGSAVDHHRVPDRELEERRRVGPGSRQVIT